MSEEGGAEHGERPASAADSGSGGGGSPELCCGHDDDEVAGYGTLFVLGQADRAAGGRFELGRRPRANGVRRGGATECVERSDTARLSKDEHRHTVTYSYAQRSVVVEYVRDDALDMFQIGRSSEPQIDFTVVDSWLALGRPPPCGVDKPACSTISRYACRIVAPRDAAAAAGAPAICAAGFDRDNNIFLGEKACKWRRSGGAYDGLTTNGVLLKRPGAESPWREVSVDGDVYALRSSRSHQTRGARAPSREDNRLADGALVDLCGATMLYRSVGGLRLCPSDEELRCLLEELNGARPQCPVTLNTLVIPRRRRQQQQNQEQQRRRSGAEKAAGGNGVCTPERPLDDRQPYVYLCCGHVQGRHAWGHGRKSSPPPLQPAADRGHQHQHAANNNNNVNNHSGGGGGHLCPICGRASQRAAALCVALCGALHVDRGDLDHCFSPCGHVASRNTVEYWSSVDLPYGSVSFRPSCPFCLHPLDGDEPFVKLIFQ